MLDGARRFAVVVRLPDQLHADRDAIGAPHAHRARRREGAAVAHRRGSGRRRRPEAINHENGERRLVVQANVRGRDVGSFVADAQARLADAAPAGRLLPHVGRPVREPAARHAPPGHRHPAVARRSSSCCCSSRSSGSGRPCSSSSTCRSRWSAAWPRCGSAQLTLNLSASVGFIALFGVAVLNGVVMIAADQRAARRGPGAAARRARRARPRGSSPC